MNIRLRDTTEYDLDFVINAEQATENRVFISAWTREQYLSSLASEDLVHLVIEEINSGRLVGHIILAGLANKNQSIEFRRIVVTEKNKGYGREALGLIKKLAFGQLNAHRLWLDVKEHNVRARYIYESENFIVEGMLRDCLKGENGFESLIVMSILRGEYVNAEQINGREGETATLL